MVQAAIAHTTVAQKINESWPVLKTYEGKYVDVVSVTSLNGGLDLSSLTLNGFGTKPFRNGKHFNKGREESFFIEMNDPGAGLPINAEIN